MSTAHSPCAAVGLRQKVALPHAPMSPIHLVHLWDADYSAIIPTLFDPPALAALYHYDKARVLALVAAMAESQHVRQALAYAAWLDYHDLNIDLATVLAAWEQL